MDSRALEFADIARRLGHTCHVLGLPVPAFRSPPRKPGCTRTVRRYPAGATVAVRIRDRAADEWKADMVDGCIAVAQLSGTDADRARAALVEAIA